MPDRVSIDKIAILSGASPQISESCSSLCLSVTNVELRPTVITYSATNVELRPTVITYSVVWIVAETQGLFAIIELYTSLE